MLAGIAASWLWAGYVAGRRLRAAETQADRLDPGWRLADLLAKRDVIAPEDNSAIRVARVLRHIPRTWWSRKPRPAGPFAPPGSPAIVEETIPDRIAQIPPEERLDVALASEIRRDFRGMAPALAEGRKLADMDRGRTDLPLAKIVYNTLLGHVQNSRVVGHLLAVDAALRAHDGEIDAALDSCRASIAVGRAIGDEPFSISQLVRMAIVGGGLTTAERVLAQGEASDSALAKLQALVAREADDPLLLRGLRGERASSHDVFSRLAAGEHSPGEVNQTLAESGVNRATEVLATISTAYVRHNHALALESLNRAVEIAKKPVAEQLDLWKEWEASAARPEGTLDRLASELSSDAAGGFVTGFPKAYAMNLARDRALIAALGIERHRLRHGAFPDRIEAIDRDLLPSPPIDPYTGKPLLMKTVGGGRVVYSVGPDRRDDGGKFLDANSHRQPGHDLGFRLFARAARARPARETTLPADVFQKLGSEFESEPDLDQQAEPVGP